MSSSLEALDSVRMRCSSCRANDLVEVSETTWSFTGLLERVYLAPLLEELCSISLREGSVVMPQ